MSGDLVYDPEYKRCINMDARYLLFLIDKFAGAGHLVNEMTLVNSPNPNSTTTAAAVAPEVKAADKMENTKPAEEGKSKAKIKREERKMKAKIKS
jgi:hypothetical protein